MMVWQEAEAVTRQVRRRFPKKLSVACVRRASYHQGMARIHKTVVNAPRGGKYENTPQDGVTQGRNDTNDHVAALLLDRQDIETVVLVLTDGTTKTYCRVEDEEEVEDDE